VNSSSRFRSAFRRAARTTSDWVDLQLWLLINVLKPVATRAHGRLIDVGCGDKQFEYLFRPYVDTYFGVEYTETFSATAAKFGTTHPDCFYDGHRLPFADESFDTVLNIQVLEHTPHPFELVAEMARVLKNDGVLILAAPFSFRLHEEPHDYFRYTPHGLRQMCKNVNLVIDDIRQVGSLWSLIGHKVNSYLALRVARMGATAQQLGKFGHEAPVQPAARLWTLPLIAPVVLAIAAGARVMDRLFFERQEALGFVIIASRMAPDSDASVAESERARGTPVGVRYSGRADHLPAHTRGIENPPDHAGKGGHR
jgi:SAM-dependent methyltransferase